MSPYKKVKKVRREKNSHQSFRDSTGNSFGDVPFDIALDILMRLPVKSVARFLLVSKFWSETIRSRYFITSFQIRSSLQQPRLLVMFTDRWRKRDSQDSYFFSVSTSSSTTTASYLSRVTYPHCPVYCSHYVNGLINLGSGRKQCVANPSTGTCPVVPGEKTDGSFNHSFLGYDPVNDEYKILVCLQKTQFRGGRLHLSYSHHGVVTLRAKNRNEKWRRIDYKTRHDHYPLSNSSVCIDGVLYYVARTESNLSLMRFCLESEKLDLFTSLYPDVRAESLHGSTLISYKKKVALATKISTFEHEVWVLDQHGWVKKSFIIKITRRIVYHKVRCDLYIRGSTLTGEFILAPRVYSDMFCVIHYNPDTNCYRRTDVEVEGDYDFKHSVRETEALVFPDYVDCLRFCK